MSFDLLIKGGTVVDGTGAPRFTADVGITGGKITEIGKLSGAAKRTIDADGLAVAPGVIDVHTHYDAQLCWDGLIASSTEHGTTTIVQGNCGIGVAPNRPDQREAMLQDIVVLEGISYDVMRAGIDWKFQGFPEYLDYIKQRGFGPNVAALVPLSPMRRYIMGDAATERGASDDERAAIVHHIDQSVEAGALGFGLTMTKRQVGYMGKPLPCRMADEAELRDYARIFKRRGHGVLQANVIESICKPTDEELGVIDLLLTESGRNVTYSGAMYRSDDPGATERMLTKVDPLFRRGAWPQCTIMPVSIEVDLHKPFMFGDIEAFKPLLNQPREVQLPYFRDPQWRARVLADLSTGRKLFSAGWSKQTIHRAGRPDFQKYVFRTLADVAAERGATMFDTMIDLVLEDDGHLTFIGDLVNADLDFMAHHIKDPRILLGLHDGGAHVDMMFQAGFPTFMLGFWVRERQAITLEHAIRRMTSEPADYFGFADRGRIGLGKAADLMIFDPATVGSSQRPNKVLDDLPAGGTHLYSTPSGMEYVVVNGEVLLQGRQHTGALPGRLVSDRGVH